MKKEDLLVKYKELNDKMEKLSSRVFVYVQLSEELINDNSKYKHDKMYNEVLKMTLKEIDNLNNEIIELTKQAKKLNKAYKEYDPNKN